MSLLFRAALAALALSGFVATAPAVRAAAPVPGDGGKAVTFPFPANAPVVVQLTGIGSARERLGVLLKAAVPDDVKLVDKFIDEGLNDLLAGRKLTAVPKDGRVFVAVNDVAALFDATPGFAVLVPVTGYEEFRKTFLTADELKTFEAKKGGDEVKLTLGGAETPVFMIDLKEYVAITPDRATADVYAGKFNRASTAAMPNELAKSFVGSDVAVYVNTDVINEKYGEQIKGFKQLIDFGLQQAEMGGMLPGINKKQLDVVKLMLGGAFQALDDCRGVVIGVEFRPEGLNVRLQAQFAEDSVSGALLKAEAPGPLAELNKLPDGLGQYAGFRFGKKFAAVLRGLNPEFAPADDDKAGAEAVEKRLADLAAAGPQGELSASGAAGTALTATKYADAEKAVAALLGCYAEMKTGGRVQGAVLKSEPKVTKGARKHAGFTFAEVALAFDFEASVKDLPEGAKETTLAQLKRLLGEKTTLWIGTDGKTVLQLNAKDWAGAAAAADSFLEPKKPVGESAGFKLTRKQLPADASYLFLAETGQLITMLTESLKAMGDAVPGFPRIGDAKPLKGEPTYIGVAMTFKGDTATVNIFVPTGAVGAARKVLGDLFRNID